MSAAGAVGPSAKGRADLTGGGAGTRASRAKIVATLGPASSAPDVIRRVIDAGADAFRLNFSHGTHEEHAAVSGAVRGAAGGDAVALIGDLQGPRIRIGALARPVTVREGDELWLGSGSGSGVGTLPTTHDALADDLRPGDRVLIDNGLIELRALESRGGRVRCRVVTGGEIGSNKGINLPGVAVSAPAITEKDRRDVEAAVRLGVDYIALSFVRHADDLVELRRLLAAHGSEAGTIAKIERGEALEHIDDVLAAADGIMVARGDLGVELPQEKVPLIQKRLIALANAAGKPVITATEMLQSMISSPRPTRAEASDVANAILDGTDAVMLSGETAVGRYPVEAVEVMHRITLEAETIRRELPVRPARRGTDGFADAVAEAACSAAADLEAAAIVVFTMSGRTAMLVARRRPAAPIIALTPDERTRRRLALVWGVAALALPAIGNADDMIERAEAILKASSLVRKGDVVVIVGGAGPLTGATNFTKILRVR